MRYSSSQLEWKHLLCSTVIQYVTSINGAWLVWAV